jgi:hypothetical protein
MAQGRYVQLSEAQRTEVWPRLWISVEGNYWYGGKVYRNGNAALGTLESNSRVGVTASVPLHQHQSFKFSYSYGAVVRVGRQL